MNNRQQLSRTVGSHEIIHLLLRRGEFVEPLHVDQNNG
jgi:hypothetical protein